MEFFNSTDLIVPLSQIMLLMLFSTITLLFGRVKLALLINYLFTLYWGYVFNRKLLFGESVEQFGYLTSMYFAFGIVVVIFSVMGFLCHSDK